MQAIKSKSYLLRTQANHAVYNNLRCMLVLHTPQQRCFSTAFKASGLLSQQF